MDIAWACLDKKQLDGARQYFVLVLQTRNKMPPNVEGAVSRLNLAAGQSALFLGEFEPAQKYLENSKSDPACAKVAERWLPAVKWMENRKHDRQDKRVTEQDLAPLMAVLQGY
ncbi:hypothetical protein [Syntrophomonas palmitatica]|uniref:hypothetical protein n=1 Tax=Syntrophomonas palmitatica TaxID=402877 RepID=UPI0006CFB611|nr:hypothetical protein [Syntrophomonas palmitatica]